MQKMNLKKVLLSLVVVVAVFVFASCSKQQPELQNNQQNNSQNQNNQQQNINPSNDDQNLNNDQSDNQQTVDPYEGWKTYRNEERKFELKYPGDVYMKDCGFLVFSKDEEDLNSCSEGSPLLTPILVYATPYPGDYQGYAQKQIDFYRKTFKEKKEEKISIDGVEAVKISGVWKSIEPSLRQEDFGKKTITIIFSKDSVVYEIELLYRDFFKNLEEEEEYEQLLNKITANFKFL